MAINPTSEKLIPPTRLQTLFGNMAAGGVAGVTVEAVLFPLDTIKTHMQVSRGGKLATPLVGLLPSLYKGLPATMFAFPASALFFGIYEPVKTSTGMAFVDCPPILSHLSAAAVAGIAASFIRVPSEVVKQRMQKGDFGTLAKAVRGIVAEKGVRRGLYAGYGSLLLRDLPFDVIEFVSYEQLKLAGKHVAGGRDLSTVEMAGVGAVAGGFTGFVTTPPDVIKTRLMTQGLGVEGKMYNGIMDCTVRIIKEEGVRALFKGCAPRVMWITLGGSIFFGTLEQCQQLFAGK